MKPVGAPAPATSAGGSAPSGSARPAGAAGALAPHADWKRGDRAMTDVAAPLWDYLDHSKVFDAAGMPQPAALREHFLAEGRLSPKDALDIINRAATVFRRETNLLEITDPVTVCGDVHGQFYDLLKLLELGGDPKDTQYLFLGDYVDRGCFACEVTLLLFAYKLLYPTTFFMIRGNHECRHLTAYFNFRQECKYKYNMAVYDAFMLAFDCLPLAAVLNGRFLCVHGGLSPTVDTLEDIRDIHRLREPPPGGAMCDLLWADPMDEEEEGAAPDALYTLNDLRGCSYVFSFTAACTFLRANSLLAVIRAHEAQDEGFRLYKKAPSTGFPTVICIFSAPNYCDVYNNKGAIIRFQDNLMNIRQYNASPHPYYLPNFMNAFSWSLPFVAEKVTDMLVTIWNLVDDAADPADGAPLAERGEHIRQKVRAMGKIARMYRALREENESALALQGLASSSGALPSALLHGGTDKIKADIASFSGAKRVDAPNERRPPPSSAAAPAAAAAAAAASAAPAPAPAGAAPPGRAALGLGAPAPPKDERGVGRR